MPMLAPILAAVMIAAAPAAEPIRLEAHPSAQGVELRVTGSSDRPVSATYALEVTAGTNRSRQSGSVQLQPGRPVTMVRLSVGGASAQQWTARLDVQLPGGRSYSLTQAGS